MPQGTYANQLEWCETVGVRFVFRHHGASRTRAWDSARITLQGPQAHHAWSVLLKEYKEILPAPLWKKVSKVGILYIRGTYDGKMDEELKDESDEDSEVDFKEEPKDDVTKLPLQSFEKEGPPDDDDEDESEDESETETKQELAGDGGSLPAAGDGGSLPAVKVKEEEVDYEDDDAGTAPAVPGEEPVNDDVPSPAETEVETLPGGHVRLAAPMEPVSKFRATPKIRGRAKQQQCQQLQPRRPLGQKAGLTPQQPVPAQILSSSRTRKCFPSAAGQHCSR